MHKLLLALMMISPVAWAQTRSVITNTDGVLVAPENFWAANPISSIGGPYHPEYVLATVETLPRGISSFVDTTTEFDRVYTNELFDPVVSDFVTTVSVLRDEFDSGLVFTTSDPAVATVDTQGTVTHVSDGAFNLVLTVGDYVRTVPLTATTTPDETISLLTGGVAGSLREDLTRPIDDALALSTDVLMYSVRDHATGTYTRNPAFWGWEAAAASAWSAIPVRWSGDATQTRGGTLIAPDIFATASHHAPTIGSTYTYAEAGGTLHVRTVTQLRQIANTDLTIGRLDSPLPAEIPPMPIFPGIADYADKSEGSPLYRVPMIGLDKNLRAHVRDFVAQSSSEAPLLPDRVAAYRQLVNGDSASAALLADGTNLIYLWGWYTTRGGVPAGHYATEVAAAIVDMGSASTITIYDVSAYPDYKLEPPSF